MFAMENTAGGFKRVCFPSLDFYLSFSLGSEDDLDFYGISCGCTFNYCEYSQYAV